MGTTVKKSEQKYIEFDPYAGDESEVRCKRVSIVNIRYPQFCPPCNEQHPAGTRMRCESAEVEGTWQSNYVCLKSIDKALEEWA